MFFRDRLPKKKMYLVDMITLLILLSLGPGHPIPGARISQFTILPNELITGLKNITTYLQNKTAYALNWFLKNIIRSIQF
jgi:hypothetical protein